MIRRTTRSAYTASAASTYVVLHAPLATPACASTNVRSAAQLTGLLVGVPVASTVRSALFAAALPSTCVQHGDAASAACACASVARGTHAVLAALGTFPAGQAVQDVKPVKAEISPAGQGSQTSGL